MIPNMFHIKCFIAILVQKNTQPLIWVWESGALSRAGASACVTPDWVRSGGYCQGSLKEQTGQTQAEKQSQVGSLRHDEGQLGSNYKRDRRRQKSLSVSGLLAAYHLNLSLQ